VDVTECGMEYMEDSICFGVAGRFISHNSAIMGARGVFAVTLLNSVFAMRLGLIHLCMALFRSIGL